MVLVEVLLHQAAKMDRARIQCREQVGKGTEDPIVTECIARRFQNSLLEIVWHVGKGKPRDNKLGGAEAVL